MILAFQVLEGFHRLSAKGRNKFERPLGGNRVRAAIIVRVGSVDRKSVLTDFFFELSIIAGRGRVGKNADITKKAFAFTRLQLQRQLGNATSRWVSKTSNDREKWEVKQQCCGDDSVQTPTAVSYHCEAQLARRGRGPAWYKWWTIEERICVRACQDGAPPS